MGVRAEESCTEALAIYEELQHPELGSMYKAMGGLYHDRYRAAPGFWGPGFRGGGADGPQHGEMGDKAIEYYQRGIDTLVRMGLDATDKDYGACLSNIGLVYKDRGDFELALPFRLKAAIVWERVLGKVGALSWFAAHALLLYRVHMICRNWSRDICS
jgi:hypothetical protein